MNWSNKWPKIELSDIVKGPTFDGYSWQHLVSLTIPITDDWPRTVEAVQVGDLAVHEDLRIPGKTWQVTHVPTMTRFNVVVGLHKKDDLIEWCRRVQASNQDDWKELAQLTHVSYTVRSQAKDRIMDLCQREEINVGND